MRIETVTSTGFELGAQERHADARTSPLPDRVQQGSPTAAEVEQASTGSDPDPLRHVVVLASLRRFEAEREVAVVLRTAEVGQLTQAQPEHPIDERIGELEV